MKIDHPADIIMLVALAVALVCIWASCVRAEDPQMMQTIDAPTIIDWIGQENPKCAEQDKLFTLEYDKLAVDCKSGPPPSLPHMGMRNHGRNGSRY